MIRWTHVTDTTYTATYPTLGAVSLRLPEPGGCWWLHLNAPSGPTRIQLAARLLPTAQHIALPMLRDFAAVARGVRP